MNLPNSLSLVRFALVPVFPLVYFSALPNAHLWAAGVYALASATDVLDGILARQLHMITRLGRVIDPMADKLMAAVVVFCIAYDNPIVWWAAGVFFLKEILMGIGAILQYKKINDVPSSEKFGKFSAVLFFVVCLIILVFGAALPPVTQLVLVSAATACSVLALLLYLRRFIALTRPKNH
ncbi:MAG: CDP-alcohol phosphatidyltransferase family protein [Oscillospiraceae bacterium]|nr:CDP-alcohol phosphatidyltransferase family protein [Oscillospiraceae bacterium]